MAGYISKFATGATIEAILDKANNSQSVSAAEKTAWNNKVDKVTGKDLSTNDFTNEDKAQIITNKNGIAALANNGSKNRLNTYLATVKSLNYASTGSWSDNVYTHNGITFTVNSDGSLTINGTSTGSGSDFVFSRNTGTSFGGLVLTGSIPSDSGDAGISIVCRQQNDNEIGRSRNGQPFIIPTGVSVDKIVIHLVAGEKETNRTMYPMIRDAAIEDNSYQPYAPTNKELYEMILTLQSGS